MLVIKIELWPGGDKRGAKLMAQGTITNDGTGTLAVGNYKASFWRENPKKTRKSQIEGFPRQRQGPWDLLARCLGAAGFNSHTQKKE